MNRILICILASVFTVSTAYSQPVEKDKELEDQAAKIVKELKLDNKSGNLIYNALHHFKKRAGDIPLGHAKYEKLLSYVDQERVEMLKAVLTPSKYKDYEKLYKQADKEKLREYMAMNSDYVQQNGVLSEKAEVASSLIAMPENPEENPESPEKKNE
ncbi:MAG: hypothetical protein LBC98_10395 [Prevotellaceae bacterium]|jgi:hypothetical protein|nr:hypothetical protein [Prevotellaceae bacterium]